MKMMKKPSVLKRIQISLYDNGYFGEMEMLH